MAKEIVNRVAKSALVSLDLETYFPEGKRVEIDLSQWLEGGFVLREKEFRTALKATDFSPYNNCYVALYCSTEAILPGWATLLVTIHLQPFAKKVVVGSLNDLETTIFNEFIDQLDLNPFIDKSVVIKGCSDKNIPETAFVNLTQRLQPVVKSLFYGEACSSVPLFKR